MLTTSPLKLLVVDDHAAFRKTLRELFAARAIEVSEADSGEAAVRIFAEQRPDWVIMDMRMPGMGGIKGTEAIRRLERRAQVIIISQFTEPEYRQQALEAGAVDFVGKEDTAQLAERICRGIPQP